MTFREIQSSAKGMKIIFAVVVGFTFLLAISLMVVELNTNNEASFFDLSLIFALTFLFPLALMLWMVSVRQVVTIDEKGFSVIQKGIMWKPKIIGWSDVIAVTVRPMNSFGEFGGWGIRYAFNGKWGYILDGNYGIEIQLANSKTLVISVINGEAARSAIEHFAPTLADN